MSQRVLRVRPPQTRDAEGAAAEALARGIERIREEQDLPREFPDAVTRAAEQAAALPRLPDLDRTDIPFVTVDPPGAMDLDQALHLARDGEGYVVHYAIADVMAFVTPGDPVDEESHRRGETCYGADAKVPLHPPAISEDAGSLLPEQTRPALLWTMHVDARGEGTEVTVERALVRSVERLDYETVQARVDDGTADEVLTLLREVGELRVRREQERGAVSLPLPEQEVDVDGDVATLEFRSMQPAETWNAQMSLLTGFAAAHLMMGARVGVLRTLPPPEQRDVDRLRRTAKGLGLEWPGDVDYPDFIRGLDPSDPAQAAMTVACTRLLRGSGYATFDGVLPEQPLHAALAAEYAHVTAPLRRLVDRYGGEACVAICAGEPVPDWVRSGLPDLPDIMRESGRRANAYENAVVDLVEALTLQDRVGESFTGVVLERDEKDEAEGTVQVQHPAVEADVTGAGPLPVGEEVGVRLTTADPESRRVAFEIAADGTR